MRGRGARTRSRGVRTQKTKRVYREPRPSDILVRVRLLYNVRDFLFQKGS